MKLCYLSCWAQSEPGRGLSGGKGRRDWRGVHKDLRRPNLQIEDLQIWGHPLSLKCLMFPIQGMILCLYIWKCFWMLKTDSRRTVFWIGKGCLNAHLISYIPCPVLPHTLRFTQTSAFQRASADLSNDELLIPPSPSIGFIMHLHGTATSVQSGGMDGQDWTFNLGQVIQT